jgi:hypothetical protein
MKNKKESDLHRFRDFLGKIPLVKYREELQRYKMGRTGSAEGNSSASLNL